MRTRTMAGMAYAAAAAAEYSAPGPVRRYGTPSHYPCTSERDVRDVYVHSFVCFTAEERAARRIMATAVGAPAGQAWPRL